MDRVVDSAVNNAGDHIEPLITAGEAYPVLERRAAKARTSLLFSFRVFDTRTKLRTSEAREVAAGDDWAALLVALAARAVDVRLQVSDFDPIGGAALHRATWASLRHLNAVMTDPGSGKAPEALAARHPARLGFVWRTLFALRAQREAREIANATEADTDHAYPALDDAVQGLPTLAPATHHQKIAVIDDDFALIGGIDVDERRWDTVGHDLPAEETWRDVSLAVYGKRAHAVRTAAEAIWNTAAKDKADDELRAPRLPNLKEPKPRADSMVAATGDPQFSIRKTASLAQNGPFSFGPKTIDDGNLQSVLALVRAAKRFLYIETQFLRCAEVAKAIAERALEQPSLQVLIILPFAPEQYAFLGKRGTATRHGEALQLAAVNRIQQAFGDRCAVLSPAKPTRRTSADQFAAHGAGIVYVHSKVMIADAEVALIGSANLNDRSLRWDTEVSALWRDPVGVRAFLDRLCESWLGRATDDMAASDQLSTWVDAAMENANNAPDRRTGFLLPYDTQRPEAFARRAFWLPDALF